jgi:hypothetical protein
MQQSIAANKERSLNDSISLRNDIDKQLQKIHSSLESSDIKMCTIQKDVDMKESKL